MECKNKNGTGNGRDKWNNLKIFQKIPEQHTCEGTTENLVKFPCKSKILLSRKIAFITRSTRWRSWLRNRATSQEVTGSIPDYVTGIFNWHNPSGRTKSKRSTQPPIELSTRHISWGTRATDVYGWQLYYLHVPTVSKSDTLQFLDPLGLQWACAGTALLLNVQ